MKKIRKISTIAVMTVVLAAGAGCGSSGAAEQSTAGTGAASSSSEVTEAASAAESASAAETSGAAESASATAKSGSTSSSESSTEETQAEAPNFSAGLTDDGELEEASLTDLVTIPEDYAKMEISSSDLAVTDEEIQEQTDSILSQYAKQAGIKDRAVKDGDTVNIDYVGKIDGKQFDGGSTNSQGTDVTIGKTQYIDDFLEQLIGHKPGETFDINVTFPDSYPQNTDLQGKDAVFTTTVNYIWPELTDDFVKENLKDTYGYQSVDDMKEKIQDNLRHSKEFNAVWANLLADCTFSKDPDSLADQEAEIFVDYAKQLASNAGITIDEYLSYYNMASLDDLRESYHDNAVQIAKEYVIAQAISDKENIKVSDSDVKQYFKDQQDENQSTYEDFYGIGYVKMQVRLQMIADRIMKTATITEETAAETTGAETEAASSTETKAGTEAASSAEETSAAETLQQLTTASETSAAADAASSETTAAGAAESGK